MSAPVNYSEMNYQILYNQIIDYANRNSLGTVANNFIEMIPYFIFQAQDRIWHESKDLGYERVVIGNSFQIGNSFIFKPQNWNKTISFIYGNIQSQGGTFNNATVLEYRQYEYCRSYWPNASLIGAPLFYADHAAPTGGTPYTSWFICPTPDQAYYYEITYLTTTNFITSLNDTNILTKRYPGLLFYSCMLEALTFLKDDARIPVFESLYNRALETMKLQTNERLTDRNSQLGKD